MKRSSRIDDEIITPTMEHSNNVFGDENEVDDEDFDGVADGFRPSNSTGIAQASSLNEIEDSMEVEDHHTQNEEIPIHSISAYFSSRPVTPTTTPSRNSMRKSRNSLSQPNPFASSEDDDEYAERRESLQFEPDTDNFRRSTSTASSHVFARTHSQRFGASGPSHPYTMYQQATTPRSPSITTASTLRPIDWRSSLPNGPQHPYSLYPQGVDEDLDDDNDIDDDEQQGLQHNPVPVGFPGLGQNYTRRMGPDGEEQDIIGEDGHTEQLPPYTRYPDDAPEKMPLLLPTALHSRAPVAGTDPTMPLMHTVLQPSNRPQSMMDSSQRSNRHPSMASLERLRSASEDSRPLSQKNWKEASWREKAKIRFCGVPFWCYVLALAVISLIAAVLGSVIGGFVANRSHNHNSWSKTANSWDKTVTATISLLDASLIPSPTSQAPYTGTYALTLGPPQATQAQCLTQQGQQVAWDCNIVPNAEIAIVVGAGPGTPQDGAQIVYAAGIEIMYGAQASYMNTTFSTFLTVTDTDDTSAGPAFYFTALYDKVVVLPENAFDPETQKLRRDAFEGPQFTPTAPYTPDQWLQQEQVAQASDKPWFCVFNGTLLEGFIYVDQNATWTGTPSGPYSTTYSFPTSAVSMSITGSPSTTFTSIPSKSSTQAFPITSPATTSNPSATAAPTISSTSGKYNNDDDDNYSNGNYKRQANPASTTQLAWSTMPVYPYMVKLEERRLPNNPIQPYCQQYQILDNGEANWVGTGPKNDTPITFNLEENDPSFSAYESAGLAGVSRKLRNRSGKGGGDTVANGCHCQWISGGQ